MAASRSGAADSKKPATLLPPPLGSKSGRDVKRLHFPDHRVPCDAAGARGSEGVESRGECAPPTQSTPPPRPCTLPYHMRSSRCLFSSQVAFGTRRGLKSAPVNPPSPPQIIFDASGAVQAKSGLPIQDKDIKVGPFTRQGCVFRGRFDVGEGQQEQEARCRVTRVVRMEKGMSCCVPGAATLPVV